MAFANKTKARVQPPQKTAEFSESKPTKSKSSTMEKLNAWVENHLTAVPFVQKMLFVHNLYIMVKAGLSIVDALRILAEQVENKRLKNVIGQIKVEIEKGRSLSEVLGDFPDIFPSLYVSMIGAGEAAGRLEEALDQVHKQMKKSHELTSRIKGAMIYPAVLVTAMLGIGTEMIVFVLPKILVLFKDFNTELPLPTKILIGIVSFGESYALYVLLGLIALVSLIIWLNKKPNVKRQFHAFYLKLPIFGIIIKKINIARFTMTLSSLLQSTIPIIEAVRITSSVQSNLRYRESLTSVGESLKKGISLSEALGQFPHYFPPMVVQMLLVGEQSGQVEQLLNELANYYGDEVDNTMRNFSTIIEPIMILTMGIAVAGMAVAVIQPMYSLAQSF